MTLHTSSVGSGLTPQAYNDRPTISADGMNVSERAAGVSADGFQR